LPFACGQDKIISFCAFTYACLFYGAAFNRGAVPAALASIFGTVVGLSLVSSSDALAAVMKPGQSTLPYWIQTGLIAAYAAWLLLWFVLSADSKPPAKKY
jgi:hypothetical protein